MIWCQVDPVLQWELSTFPLCDFRLDKRIDSRYKTLSYERNFYQNGEIGKVIIDYTKGEIVISGQALTITNLTCTKCTCDVYGYNLSTDSKKYIYNLFNETQYIPAQQLDVINFIDKYRGGAYNSNISQQIHNVSDFIIVVPSSSKSITCYTNPMLENLQFICNGIQYPNKPLNNTYDSRFYTSMMRAGDQENFFEADNDYRNSLITKITTSTKNYLTDVTNFLITFQAKRNCNGYYFDSIETDTEKVSIQLQFSNSIYQDNNKPVQPQVWFIRDTYWSLDNKNGLKYHVYGTPPNA